MSIFRKHFVWTYPTCYQFNNYLFLFMTIINLSWMTLDVALTFMCDPRNGESICFWPSSASINALITTSTIFMLIYMALFITAIAAMISSQIFCFISLLFIQSIITLVHLVIFLLGSRQNLYIFSFLVFHIIYLVNISCVTFNQYMLQWMNYPLHTYFSDKTFISESNSACNK